VQDVVGEGRGKDRHEHENVDLQKMGFSRLVAAVTENKGCQMVYL
jgi:hypothetical protein